ncbi:MAG: hypothetical protein NTX11_02350 [Candidatus Saccharibacteria bacterium]|nr:hypothetical protein [Candidatus Saccharibacteria bacterium]
MSELGPHETEPIIDRKLPRSERNPVRWHYEKLGTAVAAGILLVGLSGITAQHIIESGRRSIATEIDGATEKATKFYDGTQTSFDQAKKRFDDAKKQCKVIDDLAPQIGAIAEAIGATPASGTTTTVPLPQIAVIAPSPSTSKP